VNDTRIATCISISGTFPIIENDLLSICVKYQIPSFTFPNAGYEPQRSSNGRSSFKNRRWIDGRDIQRSTGNSFCFRSSYPVSPVYKETSSHPSSNIIKSFVLLLLRLLLLLLLLFSTSIRSTFTRSAVVSKNAFITLSHHWSNPPRRCLRSSSPSRRTMYFTSLSSC
jgi:hypothetical protein